MDEVQRRLAEALKVDTLKVSEGPDPRLERRIEALERMVRDQSDEIAALRAELGQIGR